MTQTPALHAQVPQILNYQGRVAVGDPPVNFDGSGAFRFALVETRPEIRRGHHHVAADLF